jgi:transposase-like protein
MTTAEEIHRLVTLARWPDGVYCPRCGSNDVVTLAKRSTGWRGWKCKQCASQFSVTSGSWLHSSNLSLTQWHAIAELASRQPISAQTIQEAGYDNKTALKVFRILSDCIGRPSVMAKEPLSFGNVEQCLHFLTGSKQ